MLPRNRWNFSDRCFVGMSSSILLLNVLLVVFAEQSKANGTWHCQLQIPSTTVAKVFKNKCYYFISDEKYWAPASSTCAENGAKLVKNSDKETNDFLTSALNGITEWSNNGVWIGLHDQNNEGKWEWETGKDDVHEPVSWTNWADGHPRTAPVFRTFNDCVFMRRSEGRWLWVDAPCATLRWRYRFICESEAFTLSPADSSHTSGHAEASLVFFAIFGAAAVIVCVIGTAGGLVFYKIVYGRRRRPLLRNRLQRSEANAPRPPLNVYVELDEVTSQKRFEDVARSSYVDNDTSSGIYEEVPLQPTAPVLDVTYENQNNLAGYIPMIKQRSNVEITRAEERGNPHFTKPNTSSKVVSSDGPSFARDLTPSLTSYNSENGANEDKYEEIRVGRVARFFSETSYVQAQAPRTSFTDAYYNVSGNHSISCDGGIGRNTYERMDRFRAA